MADVVAKGGTTLYLAPEYVTAFLDAKGNRMSATLDAKDPLEAKNYFFDMTSWMASLGTSIAGFTPPTVTPNTATASVVSQTTNVIEIQVAGGVHGTTVKVVLPFATVDGQDLIATMHIPIKDK